MASKAPKAEPKFEEGGIVRLKSGGPDMTIISVELPEDNDIARLLAKKEPPIYYNTAWFAGKKKEKGKFPEHSLIAVPSEGEK